MKKLDIIVKITSAVIFAYTLFLFVYAVFQGGTKGEPYKGDFTSKEIKDGWTVTLPDGEVIRDVSLPLSLPERDGNSAVLNNTLPSDVCDGMRLSFYSVRQNITIYINGEKRGEYSTADFDHKMKSVVSALILVDLHDADAQGELKIDVTSSKSETLHFSRISYAFGNNVWYPYLNNSLNTVFVAVILILVGIISAIFFFIVKKRRVTVPSVLYLAALMIIAGMWILSESEIKQLIFRSYSLSHVFSFVLIEIIAAFAAMYFNEVQKHKYSKVYLSFEIIILLQVIINSILDVTGLVDYMDTLNISHAWSAVVLLVAMLSIFADITTGDIKNYKINAFGIFGLVIFSALEMFAFYTSIVKMGVFLGVGFMILLSCTIMQVVHDMLNNLEEKRKYSEKINEMTFEILVNIIDEKDEYTLGHSERVGKYARLIAERAGSRFNLDSEDFRRIEFVGKMHDIGKIGVPDRVLNKNGKLNIEEYAYMKMHTITGYEILKNMEDFYGLREGVRGHHERWDGKGYPDGLKGNEIHIYARILCLADSFDAMTTDRKYRRRLSHDKVIEEIEKNRGALFDPELTDIVIEMINEEVLMA